MARASATVTGSEATVDLPHASGAAQGTASARMARAHATQAGEARRVSTSIARTAARVTGRAREHWGHCRSVCVTRGGVGQTAAIVCAQLRRPRQTRISRAPATEAALRTGRACATKTMLAMTALFSLTARREVFVVAGFAVARTASRAKIARTTYVQTRAFGIRRFRRTPQRARFALDGEGVRQPEVVSVIKAGQAKTVRNQRCVQITATDVVRALVRVTRPASVLARSTTSRTRPLTRSNTLVHRVKSDSARGTRNRRARGFSAAARAYARPIRGIRAPASTRRDVVCTGVSTVSSRQDSLCKMSSRKSRRWKVAQSSRFSDRESSVSFRRTRKGCSATLRRPHAPKHVSAQPPTR